MKNRIRALVVAASLAVGSMAVIAPPAAAAGPCDNELEEVYCLVIDRVNDVLQAIDDPWN